MIDYSINFPTEIPVDFKTEFPGCNSCLYEFSPTNCVNCPYFQEMTAENN